MATDRAAVPDLATLVSFHAALDSVVEIEALFAHVEAPVRLSSRLHRVVALAAEMRMLLREVLHRNASNDISPDDSALSAISTRAD
jgi:hypothetical protein